MAKKKLAEIEELAIAEETPPAEIELETEPEAVPEEVIIEETDEKTQPSRPRMAKGDYYDKIKNGGN